MKIVAVVVVKATLPDVIVVVLKPVVVMIGIELLVRSPLVIVRELPAVSVS